jgi:hypothetical protein
MTRLKKLYTIRLKAMSLDQQEALCAHVSSLDVDEDDAAMR